MKTKSGFECEITKDRLDNMELVDALAELDENELAVSRVCLLLLGKETRKRLYDHLRTEDGRVPTAALTAELSEIMAALGETGKN